MQVVLNAGQVEKVKYVMLFSSFNHILLHTGPTLTVNLPSCHPLHPPLHQPVHRSSPTIVSQKYRCYIPTGNNHYTNMQTSDSVMLK